MERFKLRIISMVCCLSTVGMGVASAASVDDLWDKTTQIPKLNQFYIANHPASLKERLPVKSQLFTLNTKVKPGLYEYRLRTGFIDSEGVTHARYDEFYKNLRVLWADTVVHRKRLQSINGTLVTDIEKDVGSVQPKLTVNQAVEIAKHDYIKNISPKNNGNTRLIHTELVIYPYAKDANGKHVAHLAYQIDYYTTDANHKAFNPYYVIDANSGEVLKYFDNMKRTLQQVGTGPGGNTNPALTNGSYNYGIGAAPLAPFLLIQTDTPVAGTCTWSNPGIAVINRGGATNEPSIFPVNTEEEANYAVYTVAGCNAGSNYANTGPVVADANSVANDMLFYGTQAYNLFNQYSVRAPGLPFGPTSLTNPAIRLYVNIDSVDAAAFGPGCNGPDSCSNQQAFFGNGQAQFYPQVGYDVVGHELTHIYIARTSQLVYANQSGGMNEAFSDMTGVTLGAYLGSGVAWFPPISNTAPLNNPLGLSFWTQGALDSRTEPALRYLYNPPLNGSQISNAANYTAGMPVHNSSGVYGRAFFNFAQALSNGALINYAAVLQTYRFFIAANDTFWTSNSTFNTGACGVLMTANNPVYGGNTAIARIGVAAFAGVGVQCTRGLDKISVT